MIKPFKAALKVETKPPATIHFAKQVPKGEISRFGIHFMWLRASKQIHFVPGTKMKLRARGFEIVCGFVPEFVPNAYAKSRGGIRRQDSQAQQPNWS